MKRKKRDKLGLLALWKLLFSRKFYKSMLFLAFLDCKFYRTAKYQREEYYFIARPGTGFKSNWDFEYEVSSRNTRQKGINNTVRCTKEHYEKFHKKNGLIIEGIWWLPDPLIIKKDDHFI